MQRLGTKNSNVWYNYGLILTQDLNTADCSFDTEESSVLPLYPSWNIAFHAFSIELRSFEQASQSRTRTEINLNQFQVKKAV